MKRFVAVAAMVVAPLACAQELKLTVFDKLKPQASNIVDLNLSKDLLGLGAGFLGNDGDDAKVKKLTEGLNNIFIRSLEFEKEGVYSDADVKQIISEMTAPGWKLVISADEKHGSGHETSRIWIKATGNGELGGLRIMSAEPKELSAIEITGRVSLKDLGALGDLGIPGIGSEHTGQASKKKEE
jgi:hypothetical protein